MNQDAQILGCLLGTAVGDAIGLPYEGLTRRRAARLLGPPSRHRFFFGRGMVSDDTEHTCMVAQSLIDAGVDRDAFQRSLARRLRFWLLGMPAGIGLATLRSIFRLWFGYSPDRSGVFSAGNGPAMRSAILGVVCDDREAMRDYVGLSTRITHTDPKAEYAACAVALAAQFACRESAPTPDDFLEAMRSLLPDDADDWLDTVAGAIESVKSAQSTDDYAASIGLSEGVSGYAFHSVPIVIHAWLSYPRDYRQAVETVVRCGGDTDTTAAMVGAIVGAAVGREGIPQPWIDGLIEWPRTASWIEQLASRLGESVRCGSPSNPIGLPVVGVVLRNIFFLVIVLYHGFRRLAPPY